LNEVDFALVSVLPNKLKVNRVELMSNRLFYVGSSDLKFKGTPNKKKLFEDLPLIYREQGSATRNAMETFIETNKLSVRKKIELTSNEAVKQAVVSGLGCSIMPLIGIKNELKYGDLQIIPVKGLPLVTTWNLIWLKSKKLSPAASALLEFLEKQKEDIIKEKFAWINNF
jgi:DNA-binding transcriptional LysR family regulator